MPLRKAQEIAEAHPNMSEIFWNLLFALFPVICEKASLIAKRIPAVGRIVHAIRASELSGAYTVWIFFWAWLRLEFVRCGPFSRDLASRPFTAAVVWSEQFLQPHAFATTSGSGDWNHSERLVRQRGCPDESWQNSAKHGKRTRRTIQGMFANFMDWNMLGPKQSDISLESMSI